MKRIIFPGLHLILLFSIASELGAQALRKKPYVVLGVTRRLEVSPDDNPQTAIDTANPNLVEQKDLYFPSAAAVDTSVSPPILYVADTGNHRVLGWKNASPSRTARLPTSSSARRISSPLSRKDQAAG
jgi:hypothetical protein